jgi:NAD(P)H-hydrate repair Nnr-like enzyme with NAD(P)H-hydrate dehydratase domain
MQLAPARSALAALLRAAQKSAHLAQMAMVLDAQGAAILEHHPQWLAQLQHSSGIKPLVTLTAKGPEDYRLEPISATD